MTRTARAAYPRAVIKDRSESRSGLDTSLRKSGAGHHNWGALADERTLETAALEDDQLEEEEVGETANPIEDTNSSRSMSPPRKPEMARSTSGMTEEELQKARQFRKNAFKNPGDIDLSAIARTSAAVGNSPGQADLNRKSPVSDNINPLF
ncbi:hypothetical protein JR316_0012904 [Psilocybe cubensis]|uniref:Uncharacterized protein n=2 Tax=Psilocybe cubensis TaxID=181762 RepID=A0ACB8GFH7_PSICU|nr:hypothetical protein JR316_0012904 [Psilocybe cubensis]KAH9474445.1 hypothetical protein JR316_0012904 [Psilocybe cubensis]